MAEGLPAFGCFEAGPDQAATAVKWKKWIARLTNLLVAMNITEAPRKRALLLHYLGESNNDVFDTLPNT